MAKRVSYAEVSELRTWPEPPIAMTFVLTIINNETTNVKNKT